MKRQIPSPLMGQCAQILDKYASNTKLDSLFAIAGASDPVIGRSKIDKVMIFLRQANENKDVNPLEVLGKLIEEFMEPLEANYVWEPEREKIIQLFATYELQYVKGGKIVGLLGTPSKALEEFIRDRDIPSIENEFNRALSNVEINPREAVSAASNILESVFKEYITEEQLALPSKQDIKSLWEIVRKHLGFDPSVIEDQDLQRILSGLISIVDGIGALRTHASSAHGASKKSYKLESRHARLSIHAAHTVTLFILESWEKKKGTPKDF